MPAHAAFMRRFATSDKKDEHQPQIHHAVFLLFTIKSLVYLQTDFIHKGMVYFMQWHRDGLLQPSCLVQLSASPAVRSGEVEHLSEPGMKHQWSGRDIINTQRQRNRQTALWGLSVCATPGCASGIQTEPMSQSGCIALPTVIHPPFSFTHTHFGFNLGVETCCSNTSAGISQVATLTSPRTLVNFLHLYCTFALQ